MSYGSLPIDLPVSPFRIPLGGGRTAELTSPVLSVPPSSGKHCLVLYSLQEVPHATHPRTLSLI